MMRRLVRLIRLDERCRRTRTQRELVSLLTTQVVPALMPLSGAPGVHDYPWCFALAFRQRLYLGAFLPGTNRQGDATLEALCCRLNRQALLQHARPVQSLAFWQMRILCLLIGEQQRIGERAAVRQWVQALRLSLAPGWVRWWVNPPWRFGQRAPALLMENCAADYRLGPEAGVETMPWREWPACINQENTIWIWRQSRHGKYIDSQRIAITHNRAATAK